ncbi:MAG: MMPL family transporter [bacterium]
MMHDSGRSTNRRPGPANWLARLVERRPALVLAIVVVLTAACVPFLFRLRPEADLSRLLPSSEPGIEVLQVVDREFGGSEQVAVVVEAADIFAPATLVALDELVRELEALAGVNKVEALSTLEDVVGRGDELYVSRVVESIPHDPVRVRELRKQVLADSRYRDVLVDSEGRATLLLVRLVPGLDKSAAVAEIERVVRAAGSDDRVTLTGNAALTRYVQGWMLRDLLWLLPLAVFVLAGVLLASFRDWRGLLPLVAVVVVLVWTFGLVGLCRQQLTVVLVVLPPILVAVGSAYGIHVLNRWQAERRAGATDAAGRSVSGVGLPVFLAMATTVVGFGSNVVMTVPAIRWFGVFSSLGVVLSFVLALTFVPAVLKLAARGRPPAGRPARQSRFWPSWVRATERGRRTIPAFALGLLVVAAVFVPRLSTETDFVQYLKAGSDPVHASEVINSRFGGYMQFEVIIEGDIQDPGLLGRIETFERGLGCVPHVTHTQSLAGILRTTNRAFNSGDIAFEQLPGSRAEVAQYLLLLSFSGGDFLADYVTPDCRLARVTARFDRQESAEIGRAATVIRRLIAGTFTPGEKVTLGGMPIATWALHRSIQSSQMLTLMLALVGVFFLVAIAFQSARLGLAALVPVGLVVGLNFGAMGLLGIRVDIVTAMLGSIAVGIGIDYACHLIARWREERGGGSEGRLLRTVTGVGPAVLTNALAVSLGFLVLAFSSLVIIQRFGVLITEMTLLAALAALGVVPALFSLANRNRRKR